MNVISTTTRAVAVAAIAVTLIGNVGCAKMSWKPSEMFSLDNTWPFRDKDAPQEGTPTRIVCTWTDTVMSQPGKKSQRGFGGRVMFYEQDEKKPILVDGQLVVYAFDETDRDPTDNKPTRRYVFPGDQMPLHMSKNELGASYSFFLPWDEAGGPKTEVSLICRFEPKEGSVVTSEQTKQKLPGSMQAPTVNGEKKPPKLPEGVPSKPVVPTLQGLQAKRMKEQQAQLASYETAVPGGPEGRELNGATDSRGLPAKRMTSTTINLPGSFQMPNAAAVMNQGTPATGATQPAAQTYQQPLPAQPLQQQTSAANPQMGLSRSFAGTPAMAPSPALTPPVAYGQTANAGSYGVQTPQMPAAQNMLQAPAGFNTMPAAQAPVGQQQVQQAVQQAALQQQFLQQQLMQQQAMQQRMLQQQMPSQQTGQQMPAQTGASATVSYPAAGQYLR